MIPKMLTMFTLTPTLPLWMPALHSVISWSGVMHCWRRRRAIKAKLSQRHPPRLPVLSKDAATFLLTPSTAGRGARGGRLVALSPSTPVTVRLRKGFRSH